MLTNRMPLVVGDPLQAIDDVREVASPDVIEHLHRRYCDLGLHTSHTDDPRPFLFATIIPAMCVPWPWSSGLISPFR